MSVWLEQRPARTPPVRFPQILVRLTLGGLLAGLLASAWLLLVTERIIESALAVEHARQAATGAQHEELFSRLVQEFGGVVGTVLAGAAFAVVFAAVYASVRHRLPGRTDFARVNVLAAIGFGVVALLPALTIPANPPGVGTSDTVGRRTVTYGAVLLCGIVIAMLVAVLVSVLRRREVGTVQTVIAGTVLGAVLVALVVVLVPASPDGVPDDVPATMLWTFRLASLGQQAVLWAGLGLIGGRLLDRLSPAQA